MNPRISCSLLWNHFTTNYAVLFNQLSLSLSLSLSPVALPGQEEEEEEEPLPPEPFEYTED